MDGYTETDFVGEDPALVEKYLYLQILNKKQADIDDEIASISKEIKALPVVPKSIDRWINSVSSPFKISDFDRIFTLKRRYKKLMEERGYNGSKIKIFAIENVLEMIKEAEMEK